MAAEFFAEAGKDMALKLTPSDGGDFRVLVNGETILDRKAENGTDPTLPRVKTMRGYIRDKLAASDHSAG